MLYEQPQEYNLLTSIIDLPTCNEYRVSFGKIMNKLREDLRLEIRNMSEQVLARVNLNKDDEVINWKSDIQKVMGSDFVWKTTYRFLSSFILYSPPQQMVFFECLFKRISSCGNKDEERTSIFEGLNEYILRNQTQETIDNDDKAVAWMYATLSAIFYFGDKADSLDLNQDWVKQLGMLQPALCESKNLIRDLKDMDYESLIRKIFLV